MYTCLMQGYRWTTAQAYLDPSRPNLDILLNARVERVLFDPFNRHRVVGVRDGTQRRHVSLKVYRYAGKYVG